MCDPGLSNEIAMGLVESDCHSLFAVHSCKGSRDLTGRRSLFKTILLLCQLPDEVLQRLLKTHRTYVEEVVAQYQQVAWSTLDDNSQQQKSSRIAEEEILLSQLHLMHSSIEGLVKTISRSK